MSLIKPSFTLATFLSLGLAASVALAQPIHYNQVTLQAEASNEVAHDLMQVTLYTEAQNKDAALLSRQISQTLNNAITQSKHANNIQVSMGSRHSQPVYDEKGRKITAWKERAELRLESTDFAALSTLSGQLLEGMNMASMGFSVANSTRIEQENLLLGEAIKAFNERAKLVSQALGGKDYRLVNLSLNSQDGYRPPMFRAAVQMSATAEMAVTPKIEAGTSELKMTAQGVIEVIRD